MNTKNDLFSPTVKMRVMEVEDIDSKRAVVGIDHETLRELRIFNGEIIKIRGNRQTSAAIVHPINELHENTKIIQMGARFRKNIGVSIGDIVTVQKVRRIAAVRITLRSVNIEIPSGDPYIESFLRRRLLGYPLATGNTVIIDVGSSKEVQFQVVMSFPGGIVVVVGQRTVIRVLNQRRRF